MSLLDKIILGINDTHDAAAAIVRGGRVLCAVAEERLQRVKSTGGFPRRAIEACLAATGLSMGDIDLVAVAGTRAVPVNLLSTMSSLGIDDFIKIQEEVRRPFFYEGRRVPLSSVFPSYKPKGDVGYPLDRLPLKETREMDEAERAQVTEVRLDHIARATGVGRDRVHTLDHHTCHAYYAYYASPFRGERTAVLTMDAGGDGVYDSVSVADESGRITRLHASHECIIGPLYTYVTLILGMRPYEHEYKVMGLAPYAKEYVKRGPREIFLRFLELEGVKFHRNPEIRDLYFHTRDLLKTHRFDGIAGGVQEFCEHFVSRWVGGALAVTGARRVAYAGGVALNVKANMLLASLGGLDSLFVPPGSGDESLAIGAAWALMDRLDPTGAHRSSIAPLPHAYLGPDVAGRDVAAFAEHPAVRGRYLPVSGDPDDLAAEALANDKVVAVCRGAMEFGPRSLGHRSILADPRSRATVTRVNDAIKGRDFWMPFAPSILGECAPDYLEMQPAADYRYMTICAETTAPGRSAIPAALHPYDQTARPHLVLRDQVPDYHALISHFRARTGVGGVLNTSLNVHGKPIVMSPLDVAEELLTEPRIAIDAVLAGDRFFRKSD